MTSPRTVVDTRLLPGAGTAWLTALVAVTARPAVLWALGTAGCVLGAALLGRALHRGGSADRAGGVLGVLAWGLLAASGLCVATAAHLDLRHTGPLPELIAEAATVEVRGTVAAEPTAAGERTRVVLALDQVRARGRESPAAAPVLVLGPPSWQQARYGARVGATGRLVPTAPGDDVIALLIVHGGPRPLRSPGPADRAVGRIRTAFLEVTADLPGDSGALVPGIAIGDRSRMPDDLEQAMQAVSLTHVTAVSGAHFSVLSATVLAVVAALGSPRWLRGVAATVTLVGFVLLVHPQPSVLRAAAMGAIGLVALLLRRPSRALPALSVAVVVLLVADPWLARSFGFALSVLATAGLVVLTAPIRHRLGRVLPAWAAQAVAVPVAAQVMCAPVIVLLDPHVATLAVPANVLAAPALLPATVLGVLAALLAPWWPSGALVLAHGAGAGAWWIGAVARTGAAVPAARLPWPGGGGGALLLAVGTAALLAVPLVRSWRARRGEQVQGGILRSAPTRVAAALVPVVVVVALTRLVAPGAPHAPDGWWLAACDVGQGDALVARSGPRSAIVVDVGPPGTAAADCLDDLGVRRVDLLVLTHFHTDHVGGLDAVLARQQVSQVLVSPLTRPAGPARAALGALADHGLSPQVALVGSPGSTGRSGDVDWQVLWPDERNRPRAGPDASVVNDSSVVLLLAGPRLSVLALGDLETPAQDALARALRRSGVRRPADVVKVAHHGSARQSPELARLLDAPIAVVSAGAGNDYGHPTDTALDLYASTARRVLRTDLCGTIVLTPTESGAHISAAC